MNQNNLHEGPLAELRVDLVAYLDGELDAANSHRIEQLLATDARARSELATLQRTWDMLDELPKVPVAESFTQTTVEMVAVSAEQEIKQHQAAAPRRKRMSLAAAFLGLAAAGALGYAAARMAVPDTNETLLKDLPILERLESYRQVEDIEFLRMLKEQGLPTITSPPVEFSPHFFPPPGGGVGAKGKAVIIRKPGEP